MGRRLAWLVVVAVTLPLSACGGCGKYRPLGPPPEYEEPKDPGPWPPVSSSPTPPPAPPPLESSSLDASVADAAPEAAAPPPPPASTGLLDPAFLPVADSCKKDDDCAVNNLVLTKDVSFLCCSGCTPMAASKAWVTKAQKTCDQKMKAGLKPACPPWDCAAPPAAVCVSGKCQLKPR